jgi:hypothetical protein
MVWPSGAALATIVGAHRAAGAGAVLDHHRLAQRVGHLARQLARDQVVAAAGAEPTTRRIGLFG